jgi:hypothetical protein
MKAIYINLDPYLAAFAAWLKGGKSGPAPTFNPLPVAVTIPLGESAALYLVADCAALQMEIEPQSVTISGQEFDVLPYELAGYDLDEGLPESTIAFNEVPGLSALGPSLKYAVIPVSGSSTSITFMLSGEGNRFVKFSIPVLVRRETASGPVDLVDFTPPASAIAAGTDLKGATFDGNEIVAAAGTGALSAPAGA